MSAECPRCGHDIWDDCTNCAKDVEIDRLRAELGMARGSVAYLGESSRLAEAAIARVRELLSLRYWADGGVADVRWSSSIRAALEGNRT